MQTSQQRTVTIKSTNKKRAKTQPETTKKSQEEKGRNF